MRNVSLLKGVVVAMLLLLGNGYATKLSNHIQTINGAQAFFNKAHTKLILRVGVNPGSLALNQTSNKAIMDRLEVVICALGQCQFAKPEYGLGFFAATFKVNQLKLKPKKILALACSKLGCVRKILKPD